MEQAQFEAMVARLEIESRASPCTYQASVALQALPGPVSGPSAAQAWFGTSADALRQRLQMQWIAQVIGPWADKHGLLPRLRALGRSEIAPA